MSVRSVLLIALTLVGGLSLSGSGTAAGGIRPSMQCSLGGAGGKSEHNAFPGEGWSCSVYVTDESNHEIPAEVRFVLIERGKVIEELPSKKYKPYFWISSFEWAREDAGRTFVIRAYVSALGSERVLQSWVKIGPVTRVVAATASASGLRASATAKRLLRRPIQIFFDVQATPEGQAFAARWKITCTKGSRSVSRTGSARARPDDQGVLVQQIQVPLPRSEFCFVIVTGSLEGRGRVEVNVTARLYAVTT